MSSEKTKEQDQHTKDYFNQLGFDVDKLIKNANLIKQAQLPVITIPDIENTKDKKDEKKLKPPIVPKLDIGNDTSTIEKDTIGNKERIISDLETIEDSLTEIEFNDKIEKIKDDMRYEFEKTIKNLQSELNNLKDRKIPEAKKYDSGGIYKEAIYDIATRILDEILPDLFEDIPDYSLISNQISRTFNDGTVSDGIISIAVTVPNEGYRYDFKIDVPILNGIIHYPTFIQRGLKIIPLTKEQIAEELNTTAFRKIDIDESSYNKTNIFNNTDENIHKKLNNQKWYEIYGDKPIPSAVPEKSKWEPKMDKGR